MRRLATLGKRACRKARSSDVPSLTIFGVVASTLRAHEVNKIVKEGNHAGQSPQKSAMNRPNALIQHVNVLHLSSEVGLKDVAGVPHAPGEQAAPAFEGDEVVAAGAFPE